MKRMLHRSRARVRCPGSCGELVQGTIEGKYFLVTCPIDMFSDVAVTLSSFPLPKPRAGFKTVEAVQRTLRYFGETDYSFHVEIQSELPAGKGMASSSADIAAACMATAVCLGQTLTEDEIATLALEIEPTDGVFYKGITMLDHVKGSVRRTLGMPPPLRIVVLDMGGEVDTVGFNQRNDLKCLNRAKESEVIRALQMVEDGIRTQDAFLIGGGATLSALANQNILHKPLLEKMISHSRRFDAAGVNVAHSGTVVGILFPHGKNDAAERCLHEICAQYPELPAGKIVSLLPGGLTILEGN